MPLRQQIALLVRSTLVPVVLRVGGRPTLRQAEQVVRILLTKRARILTPGGRSLVALRRGAPLVATGVLHWPQRLLTLTTRVVEYAPRLMT
jgi:hypothetical protein